MRFACAAGGPNVNIGQTYGGSNYWAHIAPNAVITYSEGNLASVTITLSTRPDIANEYLAFQTGFTPEAYGLVSSGYSYTTGQLTLTGSASPTVYQTVIRSIVYVDTNTTPAQGDRLIVVQVGAGGVQYSNRADSTIDVLQDPNVYTKTRTTVTPGTVTGNPTQVQINGITGNITLVQNTAAPYVNLAGDSTAPNRTDFTYGGSQYTAHIAPSGTITYSGQITEMVVTLSNRPDGSQEYLQGPRMLNAKSGSYGGILSVGGTGGPTSSGYNFGNGQLIYSGSADAVTYQTILQSIVYVNNNDNPNTMDREINVLVMAGGVSGNMATLVPTVSSTTIFKISALPPFPNGTWFEPSNDIPEQVSKDYGTFHDSKGNDIQTGCFVQKLPTISRGIQVDDAIFPDIGDSLPNLLQRGFDGIASAFGANYGNITIEPIHGNWRQFRSKPCIGYTQDTAAWPLWDDGFPWNDNGRLANVDWNLGATRTHQFGIQSSLDYQFDMSEKLEPGVNFIAQLIVSNDKPYLSVSSGNVSIRWDIDNTYAALLEIFSNGNLRNILQGYPAGLGDASYVGSADIFVGRDAFEQIIDVPAQWVKFRGAFGSALTIGAQDMSQSPVDINYGIHDYKFYTFVGWVDESRKGKVAIPYHIRIGDRAVSWGWRGGPYWKRKLKVPVLNPIQVKQQQKQNQAQGSVGVKAPNGCDALYQEGLLEGSATLKVTVTTPVLDPQEYKWDMKKLVITSVGYPNPVADYSISGQWTVITDKPCAGWTFKGAVQK